MREDGFEALLGVAGAGGLVAGHAGDTGLGRAGLLVVDAAVAGHAAGGACAGAAAADTHVHVHVHADADADAGGVKLAFVVQVGGGDAAAAEVRCYGFSSWPRSIYLG